MNTYTIKRIRVFDLLIQPPARLVVVRVETNEPGLYGLGCATFTQRHLAVKTVLEDYLEPLLKGKDPQNIQDIYQLMRLNAYWRNGPILNNAASGVDMALWDLKGKLAGMPVYQLFGGKCREAVTVYRHADGKEPSEVEDNVRAFMEQGVRCVRCQMGGYGGKHASMPKPENAPPGNYFDAERYTRDVPKLFAHLREKLGYEINFCHDVHERLAVPAALTLAKELEPYKLLFLEDLLPPENYDDLARIRNQCSTPLAVGELYTSPNDYVPVVTNRLVDYIRCHLSAIGGLTPAWKLATLSEFFNIRTAWHGPGDCSPIAHAANVHLSLTSRNTGILEWCGFTNEHLEIFPGCPELRNGYVYANDKPGLGIDFDEKKAAAFPATAEQPNWTQARLPDGTLVEP